LRYLVYGAGAVGGYLGGCLALAGEPVVFLGRPDTKRSLKAHGLRLTGDRTAGVLPAPETVESVDRVLEGSLPDVILLTIKAYDLPSAVEDLTQFAPLTPAIVCVLNGIGAEALLADHVGHDNVIAASLTSAVHVTEPGTVRVERRRGLGLAAGHPMSRKIFAEMDRAGVNPRLYQDADRMKWSKLLTNIVANATSAILGWTPGAVFRHRAVARLELESLREAIRVMRGLGLAPLNLPGVPVALLEPGIALPSLLVRPALGRFVASGRGRKPPSLHFDIGRRKSEVGWLNGAVVAWGARLGIPTPANNILTETMSELVMGEVDPSIFHSRPEALLTRAAAAGVPGVRYNAASGREAGGNHTVGSHSRV